MPISFATLFNYIYSVLIGNQRFRISIVSTSNHQIIIIPHTSAHIEENRFRVAVFNLTHYIDDLLIDSYYESGDFPWYEYFDEDQTDEVHDGETYWDAPEN